jgi:hypothetical protein
LPNLRLVAIRSSLELIVYDPYKWTYQQDKKYGLIAQHGKMRVNQTENVAGKEAGFYGRSSQRHK